MQAETSRIDELLECLVFLTRFYGVPNSQDALTTGLPLVSGRLTTALFCRAAERGGLSAREVIQPLADISPLLLPCVLQMRSGGACILLEWNEDRSQGKVIFPQAGDAAQWLTAAQLGDEYLGRLFYVKKQFKFDERSPKVLETRDGHWFWSTLFESRGIYRDVLIASILINLFAIASPLFTMNVYDRVIPTQAYVTLWSLAIGVVIAIVFEFCSRQIRAYLIDIAGKKADLILGAKLFRQVMSMRMEYKPQSSGTFANQLRDFEAVRDFITSATLATLSDLPFCALFMFVIYLIGGPLAIVPLVAMPLILIVSIIIQWPLGRYMEENVREISLKQGLLIESIEGLEALKAAQGEGVMQKRWDDFSALAAASSMKTRYLSMLTTNFVSFVQQITTVCIVVLGVYLIHAGELSMGAMIGVVILSSRSLAPLASVVGLALRYQHAKTALKSLNQLMETPTDRDALLNYLPTPNFTGSMRLHKVGFTYPVPGMMVAPRILDNINNNVEAGEQIAVLGKIGSGKSTLLRVMARL